MSDKTGIEWTDATWNPVRGCSKVSDGCKFCYAMSVAYRYSGPGQPYEGLAHKINGKAEWTNKVMLVEKMLDLPLRWTRPRRIFVNSMSDLFHPDVPDQYIGRVFGVIAAAPQHVFQILTKRPQRMYEWSKTVMHYPNGDRSRRPVYGWPPNAWLGVSVEDQKTADERIPWLLQTPSAVRWISAEPLLGPVDLTYWFDGAAYRWFDNNWDYEPIKWVVVGGESGANARPMHPCWARSLRDQCLASGTALFFKQWGEWWPIRSDNEHDGRGLHLGALEYIDQEHLVVQADGQITDHWKPGRGWLKLASINTRDGTGWWMLKTRKKVAGRALDGRTWDEYPTVTVPV